MPSPSPPSAANTATTCQKSAWVLLTFLFAAAAISYAQRQVVAVTKEPMQSELGYSTNQLGALMSAFFAGYALFQVPLGWIGDRFGARRSLTICIAVAALATSLLPLSPDYGVMIGLWALCGAAQAGLLPIAARLMVTTLPATRRASASGGLASAMSIGAAGMSALAGDLLARQIDWKLIMLLAAVPGFVWSGLFLAWYRESPAQSAGNQAKAEPDAASLLASPALWLICAQQFLRAAGYVFFVSWFSTYLQEAKNVDIARAGWLNSLPLMAVVFGSPLGGFVSDWLLYMTGNRRLAQQSVAIVSLLACGALILPAIAIDDDVTATLLISAGSFCAAICGPISYAVTMNLGGRRVATVFGIMNMCGNFGAMLFPAVAGHVRTVTGDWTVVLVIFAAIYVAAAVCWMLINPNATAEST